MYEIPDHPEIREAFISGYPSYEKPKRALFHCTNCGSEIYEDDIYFDFYDKKICLDCFKRHIRIAENPQ